MGYIKTCVFALATVFSLGAMAEVKIAICDYGTAMLSSDMAKNRYEELVAESNLGKLRAEHDGKVADGQALQKEYEANNLSWDDQRKARYKRDLEGVAADVELIRRKIQAEQQAAQQALVQEIQPVAYEQLDLIIKEEKIDVLLKKDAVLWSTGAIDITNKLVDRLNKVAAEKK